MKKEPVNCQAESIMQMNDDGTYSDPRFPEIKHVRMPGGIFANFASKQPILWDVLVVNLIGIMACWMAFSDSQNASFQVIRVVICATSLWAMLRMALTFSRKTVAHPLIKMLVMMILFGSGILSMAFQTERSEHKLWWAMIVAAGIAHLISAIIAGSQPKDIERYLAER